MRVVLHYADTLEYNVWYVGVSFAFRKAFYELKRQDHNYIYFPSLEGWQRAKVVCNLLKVFEKVTNVVSGSKYPTSNLYSTYLSFFKISFRWVSIVFDVSSTVYFRFRNYRITDAVFISDNIISFSFSMKKMWKWKWWSLSPIFSDRFHPYLYTLFAQFVIETLNSLRHNFNFGWT